MSSSLPASWVLQRTSKKWLWCRACQRKVAHHQEGTHGQSPLHLAAGHNNSAACVALIKAGANVHATNHQRNIPLHIAAFKEQAETCRILLLAGSNAAAVNAVGATALHMMCHISGGFDTCCSATTAEFEDFKVVGIALAHRFRAKSTSLPSVDSTSSSGSGFSPDLPSEGGSPSGRGSPFCQVCHRLPPRLGSRVSRLGKRG